MSTETIYRSLFVQARGVLRKELDRAACARGARMRRSKQAAARAGPRRASGTRSRSASARPRSPTAPCPATGRATCWPARQNTHIATLVERQTRFLLLVKLDGTGQRDGVAALAAQVQALPAQLRRSLTWDRGMELAAHRRFSVATDVAVYFCDPRSPWQRGTNENTNGLLRQYFPKGTNLAVYTQGDLDAVAARLNTRPRKTLAFETPADRFAAIVALTA